MTEKLFAWVGRFGVGLLCIVAVYALAKAGFEIAGYQVGRQGAEYYFGALNGAACVVFTRWLTKG